MNNYVNLISTEIRKYLTSSLVFTCQNCMIYKYEGSESFYEYRDVSNKVYDFILDTLNNLPEIFKYNDDKKIELSQQILEYKFDYSLIIFDYYITYFNLEFIKKVFYADNYINQLEPHVKSKVLDINKYIRQNSSNVFTDYMPYFLQNVTDVEFNKIASTISHEFDRFTFEQIQDIFKYEQVYFGKDKLSEIYNGYIGEKFALSTIFEDSIITAPESFEKIEKVITETERDVMNVISDLTLLYECLNDLNILTTFVTDEAILFEDQLAVKDVYYTFRTVIKEDESVFTEQLFKLLDTVIEDLTTEDTNTHDEINELLSKEESIDEDTGKLLYILNILKTVYSEDIFDYFVSEFFFENVKNK